MAGLPEIVCEVPLDLPNEALTLLQLLFANCTRIIVRQELGGNFSGSRVVIVQPLTGTHALLPCVVKFAARSLIEKEWTAFQTLKKMLYGLIEIQAYALSAAGVWGALSYPLAGGDLCQPVTLSDYCRQAPLAAVTQVFNQLCRMLQTVHNQSVALPEFAWPASYERLLPPYWTIRATPLPAGVTPHCIRADAAIPPILKIGDWVVLEGLSVTKVDLRRNTLTLQLAPLGETQSQSYSIRVQLDTTQVTFEEKALVEALTGEVVNTRADQLHSLVQPLGASLTSEMLLGPDERHYSNPLRTWSTYLNHYRPVRVALIHGDLNLNNILVAPETGQLWLIDCTEAREDHLLHDYLRLETEVITHCLADSLATHALPIRETVLGFYRQLHCATFAEAGWAAPGLPHADLRKGFAILKIIRQSARRHLYADEPAEYYQGLLLYLLGALKFANLGPLAKQTAFWGATAVQGLLTLPPPCQELGLAQSPEAIPDAVLLDFRPEVQIERHATRVLLPAVYGLPLYRGDVVRTYAAAQAVIHCQHGPVFRVPPERNQQVNCSQAPRDQIIFSFNLAAQEQTARFVAACQASLARPASTFELIPRHTRLATTTPTFAWQPWAGATRYCLTVRMPHGQGWQRETASTHLEYPADVPPLLPGTGNTVILEASGGAPQREETHLRILTEDELQRLQDAEQRIQESPLSDLARCYWRAQLYQQWQLWSAAAEQLTSLTQMASALYPALWLQLGTVYLHLAAYSLAAQSYQQVLDQAMIDSDTTLTALAHLGLAWIAHWQQLPAVARSHLATTAAGPYGELAHWLWQQMTAGPTAEWAEPPVYTGDWTLPAYARFLAEHIVPELAAEIRQIPDKFLELLQTFATARLKPTFQWSALSLGTGRLEAMEFLAAAYLTTRALSEMAPAGHDTPAFAALCRDQAQQIAQVRLGLPSEQAALFARRYTALVEQTPAMFKQLKAE